MTKKRPAPLLPPAVLAEDLLDTPRRPDRREITWLRRPSCRGGDDSGTPGDGEGV